MQGIGRAVSGPGDTRTTGQIVGALMHRAGGRIQAPGRGAAHLLSLL
jgi:hypothetical protein